MKPVPTCPRCALDMSPAAPSCRTCKRFYQDRGLEVFQSYGTADLGMVAYESHAREGLILDEHVIVEIVRPGTGDPVAGRRGRRGRRDGAEPRLSAGPLRDRRPFSLHARHQPLRPDEPAHPRLAWSGRSDHQGEGHVRPCRTDRGSPEAAPGLLARPAGRRPGRGHRHHDPESRSGRCGPGLAEALAASLTVVTKLKGGVEIVTPGTLPNDGKVIEDLRKYEG